MTISSATLQTWFPHTTAPFLCNAPMYGSANAELAAAVTKAGGFGEFLSSDLVYLYTIC